jgi:hypothetical protein
MSTDPTNQVQNRPFARLDAQGRPIYDSVDDLAFQGDYSSSNLIYKGSARPGAATSDPVWQICFLTYSGSNLVSITWPENVQGNASNDYEFIWDDRTTYTYV